MRFMAFRDAENQFWSRTWHSIMRLAGTGMAARSNRELFFMLH